MATGILPREFAFKQRGQIPVAIVRFLLRKKKTHTHTHTHRRSIHRGVVLGCFCHCLFLIGNLVMVESPRYPKSSGIDSMKALKKMMQNKNSSIFRFLIYDALSEQLPSFSAKIIIVYKIQ